MAARHILLSKDSNKQLPIATRPRQGLVTMHPNTIKVRNSQFKHASAATASASPRDFRLSLSSQLAQKLPCVCPLSSPDTRHVYSQHKQGGGRLSSKEPDSCLPFNLPDPGIYPTRLRNLTQTPCEPKTPPARVLSPAGTNLPVTTLYTQTIY